MGEEEKWQRRIGRERAARQEAERLLEQKSLELWEANQLLARQVEEKGHQLVQEGERFSAVFQASMDGILLLDAKGKVVEVNDAALRMLGYGREQLIGMGVPRLVAQKDRRMARNAFRQVRQTGYCRYEAELLRSDGTELSAEVVGSQAKVGGQYIIQGIIRDISKRREALAELKMARDEAERANEAKSLFLATMSHEIRTPLNGIIGFTDLVLGGELSKEQRQHLSLVQRSGDILLHIINDILDFSRIESGQLELEEVDFDLIECVEEVLEIHSQTASRKGVELNYVIEEGVPKMVVGDVVRVRQVLMNLVSNALKFTNEGGVTVGLSRAGEMLRFEVSDTGVGFALEKAESLFEPFNQEDASTTRKFGGTGLGLAICRRLVEHMGGKISASLAPGGGAVFTFEIPYGESDLGEGETGDASEVFQGKRVLIVDDHELNVRFLSQRMERWGFEVRSASTGEAGLLVLEGEPVDLILTDMMMPGMDGVEFAERASEVTGAPMILVTSARLTGERDRAMEAGFFRVLFKPIRHRELLKAVKAALMGEGSEVLAVSEAGCDESGTEGGPLVLIAEDNPINARLLELTLSRMGYSAEIVGTGVEVLDFLKERGGVKAILMDMMMPEMDGPEATRRIRAGEAGEEWVDLPVIAVTANVLAADQEACREAGMTGYLAKPLKPDEVREALGEAVKRGS